MQLITDKGKTFRAVWANAPTRLLGRVIAEIEDARTISQIAPDFEGAKSITFVYDNGDHEKHDGYTELVKVSRNLESGTAQIHMERPKEG